MFFIINGITSVVACSGRVEVEKRSHSITFSI